MLIDDNQQLYPLEAEELELGQTLPWTVFTEAGQLLMREGSLIDNQRKLDNLLEKGFRHKEKKLTPQETEEAGASGEPQPKVLAADTNPFSELNELGYELKKLFERIEEDALRPGQLEKQGYELATQVQGLVNLNADAVLGAVHMSSEHPYIIQHPLHVTVIAALIAKTLKVPQRIQLSMLAASLTQNVAMNGYQMRLNAQTEPLTTQQRAQVEAHPLEGVKMLSKAGVMDRLWLQIVYQHHEKANGKGYPKGIKGGKIRPEARILALGDVYAALVTGRPYRPGMSAQQSLKSIFLERGKQFDPQLSQVFLSELGLYPPGAGVRLRNGEIALVIERTKDMRAPKVSSFMDQHGQLFMRIQQRDTSDPKYSIQASVSPQNLPKLNPTLLWGIKLRRVT